MIDIVIPWINPNDNIWFNEYKEACNKFDGDKNPQRIRDFEIFNYWFRSIETNMPWIRYIHLFLYGKSQIPLWLNTNNPKLKIHFHNEIIPEKYLPTYNSVLYFRYYYKLKDLSEKFIYFDDDIFAINPLKPTDFFENNIPKACSATSLQINSNPVHEEMLNRAGIKYPNQKYDMFQTMVKNTLELCSSYTNKPFKIYRNSHVGITALKSEVEKIFIDLDEKLNTYFIKNKFRNSKNIICDWLYNMIRLNDGNFIEQDMSNMKYMEIYDENFYIEFFKYVQNIKILCMNDILKPNANFNLVKERLKKCLNGLFPNKSSFEN